MKAKRPLLTSICGYGRCQTHVRMLSTRPSSRPPSACIHAHQSPDQRFACTRTQTSRQSHLGELHCGMGVWITKNSQSFVSGHRVSASPRQARSAGPSQLIRPAPYNTKYPSSSNEGRSIYLNCLRVHSFRLTAHDDLESAEKSATNARPQGNEGTRKALPTQVRN